MTWGGGLHRCEGFGCVAQRVEMPCFVKHLVRLNNYSAAVNHSNHGIDEHNFKAFCLSPDAEDAGPWKP